MVFPSDSMDIFSRLSPYLYLPLLSPPPPVTQAVYRCNRQVHDIIIVHTQLSSRERTRLILVADIMMQVFVPRWMCYPAYNVMTFVYIHNVWQNSNTTINRHATKLWNCCCYAAQTSCCLLMKQILVGTIRE